MRSSRCWVALMSAVVALPGLGCQWPLPETDPPTADCDIPPPDLTPGDPCVDGRVVGVLTVGRDTGSPSEESVSLEVEGPGELCLTLESRGASAAWIDLEGDEIWRPSDFNPGVTELRRRVDVRASRPTLRARLASRPGSEIRIEVRFAPSVPDATSVAASEDLVALMRAFCEEFNLNLDAIRAASPEEADALIESMRRGGVPLGRSTVLVNVYGHPSLITPLPSEDLGLAPVADPEALARAWVERHGPLLGVGPGVTFDLGRLVGSPGDLQRVHHAVRSTDQFFRSDRDELTLLLPETSLESASVVVNRLRSAARDAKTAVEPRPRIELGCASIEVGGTVDDGHALFREARGALRPVDTID